MTDRKTGFCLGDRYRSRGPTLPAQPSVPRYTSRCGLGATGRLGLVEGISVGFGDDYAVNLEGQSLTRLPTGRYLLIHKRTTSTAGTSPSRNGGDHGVP